MFCSRGPDETRREECTRPGVKGCASVGQRGGETLRTGRSPRGSPSPFGASVSRLARRKNSVPCKAAVQPDKMATRSFARHTRHRVGALRAAVFILKQQGAAPSLSRDSMAGPHWPVLGAGRPPRPGESLRGALRSRWLSSKGRRTARSGDP